jgi:hypothetical protein
MCGHPIYPGDPCAVYGVSHAIHHQPCLFDSIHVRDHQISHADHHRLLPEAEGKRYVCRVKVIAHQHIPPREISVPKNRNKGKTAVIEELDDLELVDDEDEAPAKPSKKTKAKTESTPKAEKAESTGMGASWLAEYINEEVGTEYTAAQMRVILRRLAADGELEREVGTDRARYQFTGEKDPIVRAVLKRVRSGEADSAKAERIEAARSGKSPSKRKKDDDDDNGEAEEKPVKAKRKKAVEEPEAEAKPVRRKRKAADDE